MNLFFLGFCYAFFFYAVLNYLQMRVRIRCEEAFQKKLEKYSQSLSEQKKTPSSSPKTDPHVLKVVFLHPDLGIGGAERLVVDAAVGLLRAQTHCRCDVRMVTTHHEPKRAFPETVDGSLRVTVYGDWLPRSLLGRGIVCCTTLRMLYAAFRIGLTFPDTDVIVVDQVPAAMVLLQRLAPRIPRFFYCHFPDQLCDGRRNDKGEYVKPLIAPIKAYRDFFDSMEAKSMNTASAVYCNSQYSRETTARVFPALGLTTKNVLCPPVPLTLTKEEWKVALMRSQLPSSILRLRRSQSEVGTSGDAVEDLIPPERPLFVSINRYERKKNIELAIRAFCIVKQRWLTTESTCSSPSPMLVVGGGYDLRLEENKGYDRELRELVAMRTRKIDTHTSEERRTPTADDKCIKEGKPIRSDGDGSDVDAKSTPKMASSSTCSAAALHQNEEEKAVLEEGDILFLHNLSDGEKAILLHQMTALLYTPLHEHFGIVPLEAMQVGKPVVAVRQCGPIETVGEAEKDDTAGGLLVDPESVNAFADAMFVLATDERRRSQLGEAGRKRVAERFSMNSFADCLAGILADLHEKALEEASSEMKNNKKLD